jgi:dTDP-4-dehydrorhamnose reductase
VIGLAGRTVAVLGGRTGLLGRSLVQTLRALEAHPLALGRQDFDPLDSEALARFLDTRRPDCLVNAVAYTAVDQAEDEPGEADRLNRALPGLLARACRRADIPLLHFSTDFVFDGNKDTPYVPEDEPNPLSVYGRTKLEGEREALAAHPEGVVIARTAWLFGPGKGNFVHKIVTLARTRETLSVVHDQTGSPTFTPDLADLSLALLSSGARGVFHVVNAGRATWCELAAEAVAAAGLPCRVLPITTDQYPVKATRPAFSVLDTGSFTRATGITPRSWLMPLREYVIAEFPGGGD